MAYKDKEKKREHDRQWYAARKLSGLCRDCNNKALPGMVRCERHLNMDSENWKWRMMRNPALRYKGIMASRIKRENRHEQSRCVACGRKLDDDSAKYCIACSTNTQIPWKERRRLKADVAHYSTVTQRP